MNGAVITYQVPEEVMDLITANAQKLQELEAERLHGRYLTTEEAAAYLRRSRDYIIRIVAKEVPSEGSNPRVFDIRDLDAWFKNKKVGAGAKSEYPKRKGRRNV